MKVWWTVAAAGMAGLWITGFVLVTRTAAQGQPSVTVKGKTASETFKNVTTASLKDLPIDDFIAAMGVIADDLGLDCSDCHPGAGPPGDGCGEAEVPSGFRTRMPMFVM